MRIKRKLILGFVGIAASFGLVVMVYLSVSRKILQESLNGDSLTSVTQVMDGMNRLRDIGLGVIAALTILGVVSGILIFSRISKPLSKLRAAINKIADGDLDVHVDTERSDEIGELASDFNHMVEQLRKAEKALDVSQGKFNAMLRAISDDIGLIDRDLNVVWTNTAAEGMYGDDIIGRKCYEVYHHRSMPCEPYPCPAIKAFYDNQVHQYETMLTDKNGRTRYLHCVANVALRDEHGHPQAVLEICRDITERRQTEDALRASERQCSDLVLFSPDAIISLDKTGNFLSFNAAAERMTGFSAHQVLGKHFTKIGLLAEESIQKTLKEFGLLLARVERPPFELVVTRTDKSCLVMEANARLIEQKDRETWVQLILRDVTERKEAERALNRSENLLRTIVLATKDAMIVVRGDGRVNLFNPAAEKMFGRSQSEMIGKSLDFLIPEKYRQEHSRRVRDYLATNAPEKAAGSTFEVLAQHSDGHIFPIELSLSTGVVDNKPVVIAVARDITERKNAEESLEKLNGALETTNLELIRTNRELEEFAYITAHDLKTPLRAIGTLADWLFVDYADKFDEQGKEHIGLLVAKARQMSLLIDDILRYSGAGQIPQKSQEVDLIHLVSEVIGEIAPPEHIEVTIEDRLPTMVCKKNHVVQIFQNLLSNAVKYMDKPKGQIKVACVEQEDTWRFSVTDNGPGIEKKYFDKIFKIFQTLSPREGVESTGIGLSIVKKLVELSQGIVWVESEVGCGSTFFFTLPKSKRAKGGSPKAYSGQSL